MKGYSTSWSLNNPIIRPYFLGKDGISGTWNPFLPEIMVQWKTTCSMKGKTIISEIHPVSAEP